MTIHSIFCGPLEKELWKRLVKFFVLSVALHVAETWTLRRNEQKRLEAYEVWIWRRMKRVKWTDKIKNAVVLERVGEGRIMLEMIRNRKRNWLGHWLRRYCLLKDALEQGSSTRGPPVSFDRPENAISQNTMRYEYSNLSHYTLHDYRKKKKFCS